MTVVEYFSLRDNITSESDKSGTFFAFVLQIMKRTIKEKSIYQTFNSFWNWKGVLKVCVSNVHPHNILLHSFYIKFQWLSREVLAKSSHKFRRYSHRILKCMYVLFGHSSYVYIIYGNLTQYLWIFRLRPNNELIANTATIWFSKSG